MMNNGFQFIYKSLREVYGKLSMIQAAEHMYGAVLHDCMYFFSRMQDVFVFLSPTNRWISAVDSLSAYIDLTDEETSAWKAVKGIILEGRIGELIETYQIEAE